MKTLQNLYCLLSLVPLSMFGYAGSLPADQKMAANIYRTISVKSCDSLIKANEKNPNFVILDVRTPDFWAADHLTGSINRNYYDTDFNAQLNALPKQKMFLLHCQSGGRSAPTLTMMKNLNFTEVYEMSGGINVWKNNLLPTTAKLAPRLMLVSNGGTKMGTLRYGVADTLKITVTNRANDTIKFSSITLPSGNEFFTDFDLKKKVKGSEDYSFSVFYKPQQFNNDSVSVVIRSNGGDLGIIIMLKKGTVQEIQKMVIQRLNIYPNPASGFISFGNIPGTTFPDVTFINCYGQMVKSISGVQVTRQLDTSDLPEGIYIIRVSSEGRTFVNKLLIKR